MSDLPSAHDFRLKTYAMSLKSVSLQSTHTTIKSDQDSYEMSRWTLWFSNPHVERAFKVEFIKAHITVYRVVIWIMLISLILWTVMEQLLSDVSLAYTLIKAISSLCFFFVAIYSSLQHY
jgi:hypothetical protein